MAQHLTEPYFLMYQYDKPLAICRVISVGAYGICVEAGNVNTLEDDKLKLEFVDPRGDGFVQHRLPVVVTECSNGIIGLSFDSYGTIDKHWRKVVTCFLTDL